MSLLQMSVSAGIMILAVTIIRAMTINRLPKKTFLVLWGLVLSRLLVPYTLPSPLSVYSLINYHGAAGQITDTTTANLLLIAPVQNISVTNAPSLSSSEISVWTLVWAVGVALCAFYFILAYIRCHRKLTASQPMENEFMARWLAGHKLKRTIDIRQSGYISSPLTYGIIRPVILIPKQTDWTDSRRLQYVLEHEYTHILRFDAATKILLTAALCVHWFNPLMWVMYLLANQDLELSCDEAVVRSFGDTIKSAYALALISMEERKSGLMSFYNSFNTNAIEERIKAIMRYRKTSVLNVFVAGILVVGLMTGFSTSAAASNTPTDEKNIKSEINIFTDYSKWGVTYQDGAFYYGHSQIRIFMDLNADNSFENFSYNELGSVNLRLIRDSDGSIVSAEYISNDESDEILSDLDTSSSTTPDQVTTNSSEIAPTKNGKMSEDIARHTMEEVPSDIQAAIDLCNNETWYVIEGHGRQYIYYNNLPHNYAYQFDPSKNNLVIVDIDKSSGNYVLLSVYLNSNLTINYNSKSVTYTKVTL